MTRHQLPARFFAVSLWVVSVVSPAFGQIPEAPPVQKPEGVARPALPGDPYPPLRGSAGTQPAQPSAVEAQPTAGSAPAVLGSENQPTVMPTPNSVPHGDSVQPPAEAKEAPHAQPSAHDSSAQPHPGHQPVSGAVQHSGSHGHHEDGPLIENWISFDYGPGKTHKHPPFAFALLNFAVFVYVLKRFAGKPFSEFLAKRHLDVRKSLDRARELEQQAEAQLEEFRRKSEAMQTETEAMLRSMSTQAELERQQIVARAEAEAEKLLKDAETQVQRTIESAKRDLERRAALLAVDLAEKLLAEQVNDLDQRNRVELFVNAMEAQTIAGGRA